MDLLELSQIVLVLGLGIKPGQNNPKYKDGPLWNAKLTLNV